jgi:ATP-dependent Zn protease
MATVKDKNALKEFYHTSLNAAVAKARETIVAHKDKFEALAKYLYKHDTASGEVVESILKE